MEEEAKGFFGKLFDFSFKTYITPSFISILYGILVAVAVLGALGFVIQAFGRAWWLGLIALLVSPVVFLLLLIGYRVGLEVVVVLFRIAEDLRAIRQRGGEL